MTENELRINGKSFDETITQLEEFMESDDVHGELFTVLRSARDFMENLNEEIQQYRAIGTVEELQKKMEKLERWHTERINDNIKNPFAYTSTSICHNCDHKDEYIEELEAENEEYKSIGTIDEFKALKEKSVAKKPFQPFGTHSYKCSNCWKFVAHEVDDNCDLSSLAEWCPYCGSRIDWSE